MANKSLDQRIVVDIVAISWEGISPKCRKKQMNEVSMIVLSVILNFALEGVHYYGREVTYIIPRDLAVLIMLLHRAIPM